MSINEMNAKRFNHLGTIGSSRMFCFCVVLSLSLCLKQATSELIESYSNILRSNEKNGKVVEMAKGHNKFSCAMVCSRKPYCKMAILDEKENTCLFSKTLVRKSLDNDVPGGRYLYILMVR